MNGSIRKKFLLSALLYAAILWPHTSARLRAQQIENAERKPILSVEPIYPAILKQSGIAGTVRLTIVISPRGAVQTVRQVGGNPCLVEAATTAIKKWKYAPAPTETTQQVTINFR
jgi:TonB family protein